MIPRYGRREMTDLWSREHGYSLWLKVELLALEGLEAIGRVPPGTTEIVRADAAVNVARIDALEAEADRIRAKVEEALGPAPVEIDELIRQLGAPPAAVLTVILELELAGRCARHPGNRVSWV